jgi:major membrane immunogen (membrane-anchored lipoprotein)
MRMKLSLPAALAVFFVLAACDRNTTAIGSDPESPAGSYRNGVYEASLPADYEGYSARASLTVTGNRITVVDWSIYDERNKRFFDDTYEQMYTGNPVYIQQCRDNRKGMALYGPRLIETQEMDSVDCVTAATWVYGKFGPLVRKSLKDARLDTTAAPR